MNASTTELELMQEEGMLNTLGEGFPVAKYLEARDYLGALGALIPCLYGQIALDEPTKARAFRLRDALFAQVKQVMHRQALPPRNPIKFGTSGWRGLLVEDFTVHTVTCMTRGLVETLSRPEHFAALGISSLDELRTRGCVVAHDTRIMGPELAEAAMQILFAHGITVHFLGMATTPEVSAAIDALGAAMSINFTPSHNPFTYHGYKFNPADGGPAPASLTVPVASRANEVILGGHAETPLEPETSQALRESLLHVHDPVALYIQSLSRRLPWLDLRELIRQINDSGLELYIDNGFGATRGKYEQLLKGVRPELLKVFHGEQDWLFGGKNCEPSVPNFRLLQAHMRASQAPLAIGIMNDGDGDRFVGGGRESILVMNKFGPLVVRYLTKNKGLSGDVTRSVMTSHMADAACAHYCPQGRLHETAVGFQYLREGIPTSVNSWEESDGMSPFGWSLDKDGLIAALLLAAMVLEEQKTPEALLAQVEEELGSFYFERTKVGGRLEGAALKQALKDRFGSLKPGDTLAISGRNFAVARVITLDGTKVVFENGWWFGVRPSGTEPVVRPYVETFTRPGASDSEKAEAKSWQEAILGWLEAAVTEAIG